MKKVLLVMITLFTLNVFSQETKEISKDAMELMEIITKPAFEPVIEQFTAGIAEDKKADFKKAVEATFPSLLEDMASLYMDEFTAEEIKGLLKFYKTDLGQKLAGKTAVMSQKGMAIGQSWGMKIYEIQQKFQ